MKIKNTIYNIILIMSFLVHLQGVNAQPTHRKKQDLISEYLNKGYDFQMDKMDSLAVLEYEKVLALDQSNHTAYYNLALVYAKSDRELKAIEIANAGLANCTENLNSFYRLKGNCLSGLKKYDEALPMYHQALMLQPSDSNLNYNLGYTYFMLNKRESALIYLKEYVENEENKEESNYDEALFYIGTCYLDLKKNTEAIGYFDLAIAINPYYSYYFNKTEALMNLNRKEEGLQLINFAIDTYPEKAALYRKRYYILVDLKQVDKASIDLKKAFSLDPNDGDTLLEMGIMYGRENNMEKAIEFYQKCISSKQNLTGAYANLANIYSMNELMQNEALVCYQKSISEEPNNANLYYNFGNYYRKMEQFELATNMYEKAIELDPSSSQAYINLSAIGVSKMELDKAITYIFKAIAINPDDFTANAQAAMLYFKKKDYPNVIKYSTKALLVSSKESKNEDLLNTRGVSRQIIGDYKNALYDYLEIVENYSILDKKNNASIFSNIGYCYMEDDQLQNSLKYFKEAVEYKPEIDQLIGLFTVQYLLDDKTGFNASFRKAKIIDKRLKEGFDGILKLEGEGYFYTEKHKFVLKKIFNVK